MKEYKSSINSVTANNCVYIIQHELHTIMEKLDIEIDTDWQTIKDKACSIREMVDVLIDVAKEENRIF